MPDYTYTLILKLQAPIISQAVGVMAFGFDKAALRDDKICVLPGSLIRGNLRHALEYFVTLLDDKTLEEDIRHWFGPKPLKPSPSGRGLGEGLADQGAAFQPPGENELAQGGDPPDMASNRACLHFDYYWKAQTPSNGEPPRYRIQIDETTGTVKTGHLLVIETPYASGQTVEFTGEIIARLTDETEAKRLEQWLGKAAAYLPAVGALKGVGFGKLVEGKLKPLDKDKTQTSASNTQAAELFTGKTRIGLTLKLDRPFCIAQAHTPDSNLFRSEETIPGGVIKGALAHSLSDTEKKALDFDHWIFTHARPALENAAVRERVIPWSLCTLDALIADGKKDEKVVDLILPPKDCALNQEALLYYKPVPQAPTFQIDWKDKDWGKAKKACGIHANVNRHLAVHTAINPETGQAAESQLFSLDCIDPKGHEWCADVDLSAINNDAGQRQAAMDKLLQVLSRPLLGIGKTKAIATPTLRAKSFSGGLSTPTFTELTATADGAKTVQIAIVTLQTPARMLLSVDAVPASGGEQQLRDVYADYWHKHSGGSLSLVRYFARQRRVGGEFLRHYYWNHQTPKPAYQPLWLTEPGSVFLLQVENADMAKTFLEAWQRLGLPQPEKEKDGDSAGDWKWNPYIRENGYGEIRVNDRLHTDFQAEKGEWECL